MKITKGYLKIKLEEAKEEEDDFLVVDAGNMQRYGEVVEIALPFRRYGMPDYKVGDTVLLPLSGVVQIREGKKEFVICLQTSILQYDSK